MKRRIITILLAIVGLMGQEILAQNVLADFESGSTGRLRIGTDYDSNLFSAVPRVRNNPSKTGINTSEKCVTATNVPDAGWWKNFLILSLKQPVTITDDNRILSLLAYRSIQPKDMRIGFNTYEESGQLYQGKLSSDGEWERISLDLTNFKGETLKSIYIILSCNWSSPTSGWGNATYCFDDITLSEGETLPTANVTIDTSIKGQTIQGFGSSDCWTAEYVSDYFSEKEKTKAAKWLFSSETDVSGNPEGIGLSFWRVNIGAGSASQGADSNIEEETHRTECFLNEDGTYDWTRCDGQQWFMRQAKEYGVEHFVLFSNSPPIYYTKTGKANTNGQTLSCNLKTNCFDDFADFLATTAQHFADEGYNITYISPVNEPQYDWKDSQEGAPWDNKDIRKLVSELDRRIRSRQLSTKILIPEAGSWYNLYGGTNAHANNQMDAFFKSSNQTTFVGTLPSVAKAMSGHSYWTVGTNVTLKEVRERVRAEAEKYGVEVMQTEWSMLDDAPSEEAGFTGSYGTATKMDIALYMGKVIYSDLAYGNMTGWSYWTAFSQEKWGHKNRFHLIRLNATTDTSEESNADIKKGGILTADKNLWVLGNYCRFIRPGYQRVEVEGADELNALMGSAWLSPDAETLVAVFVNMDKGSRKLSLTLSGFEAEETNVFVTDKNHDLQLDPDQKDAANLKLPSRSVVTVVMSPATDPNGIQPINNGQMVNDKWLNSKCYDLSGREVSAEANSSLFSDSLEPRRSFNERSTLHPSLKKGIYIQNGKKILY
ncbi:MAG: xylanase [Bacteroidaceae bacterium]|nr:xylanase [Bacteroidaceae bacterium]